MRDVLVCSWRHIPSLWVSLPTVKLSFLDAWATRPGALKQSASRRDSFRKWTLWVVVSDGMVPVVTDTASSFTVVVKEQKKKENPDMLYCVFFSHYIWWADSLCHLCVLSARLSATTGKNMTIFGTNAEKKSYLNWLPQIHLGETSQYIEWANTFDLSQSSNRC